MQSTTICRKEDTQTKRQWYKIDASGFTLGKLAVLAANILRGKNKVDFTPNVDCGDHLIIVNTNQVVLTANKSDNEFWYNHSGYIGGLRKRSGKEMIAHYSDELVTTAIKGMLPKNHLSNKIINKLHVYKKQAPENMNQAKDAKVITCGDTK